MHHSSFIPCVDVVGKKVHFAPLHLAPQLWQRSRQPVPVDPGLSTASQRSPFTARSCDPFIFQQNSESFSEHARLSRLQASCTQFKCPIRYPTSSSLPGSSSTQAFSCYSVGGPISASSFNNSSWASSSCSSGFSVLLRGWTHISFEFQQ